MTKDLLQWAHIPNPLLLEGSSTEELLRQLSQKTLCENHSACGTCIHCKQMIKGYHPDWILLDGACKMEDVRRVLIELKRRPYSAHTKVLMLTHFDQASASVQNAFLKTFEEPSPKWHIFMGATSKLSILPTLRSRCLVFSLSRLLEKPELTQEESSLYSAIQNSDEWKLAEIIEPHLKERSKFRDLLMRLLKTASAEGYPGTWMSLAEGVEGALEELDRNLHPKIVWEALWLRA